MEQVGEKRVELIVRQLDELPTLPAVAVRIMEVTASETAHVKDVVRLIESDPALCAKILKLVHAADLGVSQEVSSIQRAIVLLGFEAVRCAVLAVTVLRVFPTGAGGARGFDRQAFWTHSLAVACGAELLARQLQQANIAAVDPSEAFVCGLLHDLGKVALDAGLPKSFQRVVEATELLRGNIADVERSVIGLDHMVVGKRLAERWNLPACVRESIWLHGQHPNSLPSTVRNARLVNLVTLADELAREQHLGYSGNHTGSVPRAALLSATGVTDPQVQQVQRELVQRIEERAAALGLDRATTADLYNQALEQANQELGRLSEQLAAKNRRLGIRAKFFDALSEFQGDLRPDAPAAAVIQAIGQTAVGILQVSSCGVFSLPPGQSFADVMLFDSTGDAFEKTLVDCPQRPEKPSSGSGPVLVTGDDMEWLISAISPRLPHEQRFWICLEADGQCVGGVVWGATRGEAQRLSTQINELSAMSCGWSLALRTAQIREESRTLAEQLAESNRQLQAAQTEILRGRMMSSIGEMAAGAAHEMNNPLAVISGRSQLMARELSDPRLKQTAELVFDQAQRLSQIISDLMEFAKPTPPRPEPADLSELLGKALYDAKNVEDPQQRKIETTVQEVPLVHVDVQQVSAAISEVLVNAFQATASDGQIQIHAACDPSSERVVVSIQDNGRGMDSATLKRAFDPFFSSRPAGRRRGLGLAKAMRWVECSGGTIRLESRVGAGTRAMIVLPAATAPAASQSGGVSRVAGAGK